MSDAPTYEIRHVVSFEETNLVGNVYYVNHLRWQGRCREMFLRDRCPDVLGDLASGALALVTLRCSCDFFAEIEAFDEIAVRMRLSEIAQNRIAMVFEFLRITEDGEERVARGEQQVACMQRVESAMVPVPVPEALREALEPYLVPAAAPR